jgi:hypothetical protein
MSPRAAKIKEPVPLSLPQPNANIKRWIVLGLDPSMSRTGFAVMKVHPAIAFTPEEGPHSIGSWLAAGSIKPDKIDNPMIDARATVWIRAKAIAIYIREMIKQVAPERPSGYNGYGDFEPGRGVSDTGLIICMEYPTPQNDYLWSVNRIINLIMFEDGEVANAFGEVRILLINANSNRSVMGLTQRGNTNKGENIAKAYEFIDRAKYPELDVESCDGVLMAIWGRHAASAMLGTGEDIPEAFKLKLCRSDQTTKGKGRNAHLVTNGIMHRTEYWYCYQRAEYTVAIKDATNPKKNLKRVNFSI